MFVEGCKLLILRQKSDFVNFSFCGQVFNNDVMCSSTTILLRKSCVSTLSSHMVKKMHKPDQPLLWYMLKQTQHVSWPVMYLECSFYQTLSIERFGAFLLFTFIFLFSFQTFPLYCLYGFVYQLTVKVLILLDTRIVLMKKQDVIIDVYPGQETPPLINWHVCHSCFL